jgi:hypothetical protein
MKTNDEDGEEDVGSYHDLESGEHKGIKYIIHDRIFIVVLSGNFQT